MRENLWSSWIYSVCVEIFRFTTIYSNQISIFIPSNHAFLCQSSVGLNLAHYNIVACVSLFSEWTFIYLNMAALPLWGFTPLYETWCTFNVLRTAGWEVDCTLGAHKARQDQAPERKETFPCIHEYHSSQGGRRTKPTEVNDFLYLQESAASLLPFCSPQVPKKKNK